MIYKYGGTFFSTLSDSSRMENAYRHESIEFVVNQSIWMEGETQFADIILPACTQFERYDIGEWGSGGGYPEDPMLPIKPGPDTHIWTPEKRVEHVLKLKPEICTLDLVTAQVFGGIMISTEQVLTRMATLVRAAGVRPEIELFDAGDAVLAKHLIGKGVLDGPGMYSFVMGLNFTMPADTETMTYIRNLLPAGAQFQEFGIGRNQIPMAIQSALLGGHVRVGMEDNAFIRRGVFAKSNAEQVTKVRRMVEDLGSEIASPHEARGILSLRR